jgi:hypothetical protein
MYLRKPEKTSLKWQIGYDIVLEYRIACIKKCILIWM